MLDRLSKRETKLLYVLMIVIIIIIAYQYLYGYYWKNYVNYQEKISNKENEIVVFEDKLKDKELLEREISKKESIVDEKMSFFDFNLNAGMPWVQVGKMVNDNNLKLSSLQPQGLENSEYYSKLSMRVRIEGATNSIISFLKNVENLSSLWVIENYYISDMANGDGYIANSTIDLSIYGSLSEDEVINIEEWMLIEEDTAVEDTAVEDTAVEVPPADSNDSYKHDEFVEEEFIYRNDYSFPYKEGGF